MREAAANHARDGVQRLDAHRKGTEADAAAAAANWGGGRGGGYIASTASAIVNAGGVSVSIADSVLMARHHSQRADDSVSGHGSRQFMR